MRHYTAAFSLISISVGENGEGNAKHEKLKFSVFSIFLLLLNVM